jgi:hypothetical protein
MARPVYTIDVSGFTLQWAKSWPGLVGRDLPLIGVHLSQVRSPQRGAVCQLALSGTPTVDLEGYGHTASFSFTVTAVGSEGGAHRQAERGCRAVAVAMRAMTGTRQQVTINAGTPDEATAVLTHVHTVGGPSLAGDKGGEIAYRADGTFVWQTP